MGRRDAERRGGDTRKGCADQRQAACTVAIVAR